MNDDILDKVAKLKSSHPIRQVIDRRLVEFSRFRNDSITNEELFLELSFCLMTANFSASGGLKIQNALGDKLINLGVDELAGELARLGHRFPNARAKYIFEARNHLSIIKEIIFNKNGHDLRDWFFDNVLGLGMKESSHFLRNIGFVDFAIVDFHIIDILSEHGLIESIPRGKGISKKKYLEIEEVLKELGKKLSMNMAELDLYLWYLETGKVLK